jgi:hypothetical protein
MTNPPSISTLKDLGILIFFGLSAFILSPTPVDIQVTAVLLFKLLIDSIRRLITFSKMAKLIKPFPLLQALVLKNYTTINLIWYSFRVYYHW